MMQQLFMCIASRPDDQRRCNLGMLHDRRGLDGVETIPEDHRRKLPVVKVYIAGPGSRSVQTRNIKDLRGKTSRFFFFFLGLGGGFFARMCAWSSHSNFPTVLQCGKRHRVKWVYWSDIWHATRRSPCGQLQLGFLD